MARYNTVTVNAAGKLNLMLDIVGRHEDGYHELETVMQSVDLYDTLTLWINGRGENEIICSKEGFPCDSSNLIWKAVDAFCAYTGTDTGGISVRVEKRLPSMAGMAGGSADCAATLGALNEMFDTRLSREQLCDIGVKLGADVPFCIVGGTQLCRGIGEKMQELKAPSCVFVVVKPEVSVSTPAAFKRYDSIIDPERCDTKGFVESLERGGTKEMCQKMFNALEYACSLEGIDTAKRRLVSVGAQGALMTGSGSAVFGVFTDIRSAKHAFGALKHSYTQVWVCNPASEGWVMTRYE